MNCRLLDFLNSLTYEEKFKFADACGCRVHTLIKIAQGLYNPSAYLLFKISFLTGMSPVELLNETYIKTLQELILNGYVEMKGRDINVKWNE